MLIYHGSPIIIEKPSLSKGKPNNDYGVGFYCTESCEMAKEWACKGKEPPAFVNVYELDLSGLTVLDLSLPPYHVLNWISVLLANRTFQLDLDVAQEVRRYLLENFLPPIEQADVVVGYRADDSYFKYAEAFVGNGLSVSRLNEALRLGKLGLQVALRSERAFAGLKFVRADEVAWDEYHVKYMQRDTSARAEWRERLKGLPTQTSEVFAMDILRRGLKRNDPGLREILPA